MLLLKVVSRVKLLMKKLFFFFLCAVHFILFVSAVWSCQGFIPYEASYSLDWLPFRHLLYMPLTVEWIIKLYMRLVVRCGIWFPALGIITTLPESQTSLVILYWKRRLQYSECASVSDSDTWRLRSVSVNNPVIPGKAYWHQCKHSAGGAELTFAGLCFSK